MLAYDQLPKTLRAALRSSGEQFSARQLFELWRGGASCAELVRLIRREDSVEPV